MVERKNPEKEKKTVKIKATTGAWWKSKPSEEKVDPPAAPTDEVKTPKPKRASRSKKAATPPSTPQKKAKRTAVKKEIETETSVESVAVEGQKNEEAPETPARKKPAPRKRATKPRASRAKAKPAEKDVTGEVEVVQPVSAEEKPVEAVAVEVKEEATQPQSPKPRRGRRPKAAPKKKTVAADSEEGAAVADAPEAVVEGVTTEAVEKAAETETVSKEPSLKKEGAEEAKTPKPKPRRGRRPKAAPKKKDVPAEADDLTTVDELPVEVVAGLEVLLDKETEAAGDKQKGNKKPAKKKESPKKVEEEPQEEVKKVSKLLINAEEPEECRLALLEDGRLESINVSTTSREQRKNNIYKARIVAIEPSLQAAFVEYGTDKNGFLPFSEIHPEYFKQDLSENLQHLVDTQQWKKLSITDVVERGQDILAQVVKEEVGKKGANMTTFLSIPGRCVVLMPGSDSSGISRKISGEQRRSQLRETMKSMELPEGIGWIVRTASVDITQEALTRDVGYLLKLWKDIKGKGQALEGVGLIYEEQHSVLRFLREHFDPSIQEILVDDRSALEQVKEFVQLLPQDQQSVTVRLHQGARPIFNQFSVEDQIESIYQPQVSLPSGGSIVIDPTEALVAIDVNSGSTSKGKNFEASIFQANMEAAVELARQLRLRDLGGLIVVDFIDMRSRKNIIAVEKQVRAAMKKDKAKVDFSRISKFGLMEISRQKLGAPIEAGNYRRCEHCKGRGTVRSVETLSLFYLRRIQTGASRKPVERIECHFPLDVAAYLLNQKRTEVSEMEKRYDVEIMIEAETHMKPADNEIIFHKAEKDTNNKKQA